MRTLFVIMRAAAYITMFSVLLFRGLELYWFQWITSLLVVSWNSWDQWKKPNEPFFWMRAGVWLETALIVIWSISIGDIIVLFLLISPIMRTCIHLSIYDEILLFSTQIAVVLLLKFYLPTDWNAFIILAAVLIGVGLYGVVIGMLIKQRDQAKRYIILSAFEREQLSKDQERIHIAGQLHDIMGQYWTSIVRALDVALVANEELSKEYIAKARNAALEGLQDMRSNVHDWQDGRQTPQQWMRYLQKSIERFQEVTGLEVDLEVGDIMWNQLTDPTATAEIISRSVIEAMTNAVRHGNARRMNISIHSKEKTIQMIVHDDGIGMEQVELPHGIGLSTMKQRIERLQGLWELSSKKGHGTQIKLTIPIA
jgi:signal transduction histidine kinase